MIIAILAVTLSVTAGVFSQPEIVDWRKKKPALSYVQKHLNKETGVYEFTAIDVLAEFASQTDVSVDLDNQKLERLDTLQIVKGKSLPYTLFELAQLSLGKRLVLVEKAEKQFTIVDAINIERHTPLVRLDQLEGRNSAEWLMAVVPVKNSRALQPEVYQSYLTKGLGRITLTPGGAHVVVMDRVAQIKRIADLFEKVGSQSEPPEIVVYQRYCVVSMASSLSALQDFLKAWVRETNHDSNDIQIKWDANSQTLHGLVPKPLASFIDSFADATAEVVAVRNEAKDLDRKTFVQFELKPKENVSAKKLESELVVLFRPEYNRNDVRFVVQVEPEERVIVRCRDWLQDDLMDSAELLQK
jgi:hypothetical protein